MKVIENYYGEDNKNNNKNKHNDKPRGRSGSQKFRKINNMVKDKDCSIY